MGKTNSWLNLSPPSETSSARKVYLIGILNPQKTQNTEAIVKAIDWYLQTNDKALFLKTPIYLIEQRSWTGV